MNSRISQTKTFIKSFPTPTLNGSGCEGISQPMIELFEGHVILHTTNRAIKAPLARTNIAC